MSGWDIARLFAVYSKLQGLDRCWQQTDHVLDQVLSGRTNWSCVLDQVPSGRKGSSVDIVMVIAEV